MTLIPPPCTFWFTWEGFRESPSYLQTHCCPSEASILTFDSLVNTVTIGSLIVQIYSQVADLGSACKLAPQSAGLPQTERLSMRVLKSILKLREVSPLVWELYTVSRKGQVTKHK